MIITLILLFIILALVLLSLVTSIRLEYITKSYANVAFCVFTIIIVLLIEWDIVLNLIERITNL